MEDRENEIISLVTYIHKKIRFQDPPFSFMDFCAAFSSFELQPGELPHGFNGEILVKGGYRIIRYRVGSKPNVNRFAIGHEIGHGFLHEDQEFQCKVSQTFSLFKKPAKNPREWEADFFSSELLMPMPVLNRLTPRLDTASQDETKRETSRQADHFGVTVNVMRSRLQDLARLREWEGEYL